LHTGIAYGDAANGQQDHAFYGEALPGRNQRMSQLMEHQRNHSQNSENAAAGNGPRTAPAGFTQQNENQQKQKSDVDPEVHPGEPPDEKRPISHLFALLRSKPPTCVSLIELCSAPVARRSAPHGPRGDMPKPLNVVLLQNLWFVKRSQ
jgi:hypothetical protein